MSLVGSLSNQYVPLFEMKSPLTIEIQLVDSILKFINSGVALAEHFSELIKAIGSMSDVNLEPSINWYNYAEVAVGLDLSTRGDCFAVGFELEAYSNAIDGFMCQYLHFEVDKDVNFQET